MIAEMIVNNINLDLMMVPLTNDRENLTQRRQPEELKNNHDSSSDSDEEAKVQGRRINKHKGKTSDIGSFKYLGKGDKVWPKDFPISLMSHVLILGPSFLYLFGV